MKNDLWRVTALAFTALVFSLTPAAFAQYSQNILYSFGTNVNDGNGPLVGLVADSHGNFFGSTTNGGTNNNGTIYELSPNSTGGWIETVIYRFAGGADGSYPSAALTLDAQGNLYGTTFYGGTTGGNTCGTLGCGTAYELSPISGGGWSKQTLYEFRAGTGGYYPDSSLVLDSKGNLFGTAYYGGAHGWGTVYELTPSSTGRTFNLVLDFQITITGGFPTGALIIDASDNLYGVTYAGGGGHGTGNCGTGCGTVFRLSPASGGTWTFTKLFEFLGNGGYNPGYSLAFDAAGNLYGTLAQGGKNASSCSGGCGVTYKLTPTATGLWTKTVLHEFTGGEDGSYPYAGVVVDAAGNVYGTADSGGPAADGTAYKLSPVSGGYLFSRMLGFTNSTGVQPQGTLILDASGNLFGTTYIGGPAAANCIYSAGCGEVYELSPSGSLQK